MTKTMLQKELEHLIETYNLVSREQTRLANALGFVSDDLREVWDKQLEEIRQKQIHIDALIDMYD